MPMPVHAAACLLAASTLSYSLIAAQDDGPAKARPAGPLPDVGAYRAAEAVEVRSVEAPASYLDRVAELPDRQVVTGVPIDLKLATTVHATAATAGCVRCHAGPEGTPGPVAYDPLWSYVDAQSTGMSLAPVDPSTRAHLKLPEGQGLLVTSIEPHSPASLAGVSLHDILLTLGDAPLGRVEDLEDRLKAAPDKPANLMLLHRGNRRKILVQPLMKVSIGPVQPDPPAYYIGVSVAPVDPALRAQLASALPEKVGLLATDVVEDGPAARAGVKANDILLKLADRPLEDQAALVNLVQKNGEHAVTMEVLREGAPRKLEVKPERRKPAKVSLPSKRPSDAMNYYMVRPGVVLPGQQQALELWLNSNKQPQGTWKLDPVLPFTTQQVRPQQPDDVSRRLDEMAEQIKELRKLVEELGKAAARR